MSVCSIQLLNFVHGVFCSGPKLDWKTCFGTVKSLFSCTWSSSNSVLLFTAHDMVWPLYVFFTAVYRFCLFLFWFSSVWNQHSNPTDDILGRLLILSIKYTSIKKTQTHKSNTLDRNFVSLSFGMIVFATYSRRLNVHSVYKRTNTPFNAVNHNWTQLKRKK